MPSCASGNATRSGTEPIVEASSEQHFDEARQARYNIEVYSGRGIPGSAGADFFVKDYKTVLQTIVDRCNLGRTVLVQASDGVSLLAIMDNDLTKKKIACIKENEQPGVRFKDWGTDG